MRRFLAVAVFLLLAFTRVDGRSVQTSGLSILFESSASAAIPNGSITFVVTATNGGPVPAQNVALVLRISARFTLVSMTAPAGWATSGPVPDANPTNPDNFFTAQAPVLGVGESAQFVVSFTAPAGPVGSLFRSGAIASSANAGNPSSGLTTSIIGSGVPPSGPSGVTLLNGPTVVAADATNPIALLYDAMRSIYFAITARSSGPGLRAILLNLSGAPTGQLPVEGPGAYAYSPDLSGGGTSGGFMLAGVSVDSSTAPQKYTLYTRPILSPTMAAGTRSIIATSESPTSLVHPVIAYSSTSRVFLVVWAQCSALCDYQGQLIGLDGQPIGAPFALSLSNSLDDASVFRNSFTNEFAVNYRIVWNPVTNEFGVSYQESGTGPVLTRVSSTGAIAGSTEIDFSVTRGCIPGGGSACVDVNTNSGHYVVVYRAADDSNISNADTTFAAELDGTGRVVSRGLVARMMSPSIISFNSVSGTFLLLGPPFAGVNMWAVELNGFGAPLSSPVNMPVAANLPLVVTRPDAPEWRATGPFPGPFLNPWSTVGIGTSTRNGGSEMRLGGCATPDPFETIGGGFCFDGVWLEPGNPPPAPPVMLGPPGTPPPPPPAPPPTGGCATPDPFVALGGGTCFNGGWLPPGMVPPASPTCLTPDPFVLIGGGTCINGGWLPPGIAPPGSTPPPPAGGGGCATPDPFVALGGGTCWNGGWLPPGIPPPTTPPTIPGGCTTPDPFVAMGGGICENGGWRPRGL